MRSEAMGRLDTLVGSWTVTMHGAWFIPPEDQPVPGRARIEWLGEAFVVVTWTMGDDVAPATSEMVLVLGRSDAHDTYTALYHDERGVSRVFDMTFDMASDTASDGARWELTREDPDMHQRFVADVTAGRIAGRWEASDDGGATWRTDFDLIFDRVTG